MRLSCLSNRIGVGASEDTRFPLLMLHGLTLYEAIEMIDLEAKIPELLVHGGAFCIRLSSSHLQGYEPLFSTLIHILNTLLQVGAMAFNLLSEMCQTLVHPLIQMLKLLKHQPKVWIHRIIRLRAMGIVVRIGFHGS
jgi:hypothetical protein